MDWITFGIWFGCGFLCRQTILNIQMKIAKKQFYELQKHMKGMTFDELLQLKEKLDGDNQHSK